MQVDLAVAKVGKWATSESGDTLEVIERPRGGLSAVLADGQRSGQAAKAISNLVVRKAIAELAEGVRDGAAARAAHDYLHTFKGGRVSATLNIVSVDLATRTVVLARNNPCPTVVVDPDGEVQVLDEPSQPVGIYLRTKPVMTELDLRAGLTVVVYTDGLQVAGEHRGGVLDVPAAVVEMARSQFSAQQMADELLRLALDREGHRPRDDISVLALHVRPDETDDVRRMWVRVPL